MSHASFFLRIRSERIDAAFRIEREKRALFADLGLDNDRTMDDLTPQEILAVTYLLNREETVHADLSDDEYAEAMDLFGDDR